MLRRIRKAIWKEKDLDETPLANKYRLKIKLHIKECMLEVSLVLANKIENL